MLWFNICCPQNIVRKTQNILTFQKYGIIISLETRTEAPISQRQWCQVSEFNREWGKVKLKPRMTNTVCVEENVRWRKPVIGRNPEKAGHISAGDASRETCWIVRMLLENGCSDVLFLRNIHYSHLFVRKCSQANHYAAGGKKDAFVQSNHCDQSGKTADRTDPVLGIRWNPNHD